MSAPTEAKTSIVSLPKNVPAIDSLGDRIFIDRKQAAKYLKRGRGHFEGELFVFARDDKRHSSVVATMVEAPAPDPLRMRLDALPLWPARLSLAPFQAAPEQHGFARYPLPLQNSCGDRYPALAKVGAGLTA